MPGVHAIFANPAEAPVRPNVVLILADDLGKYDLSSYGGQLISTPNIDRLASRGALFQHAYASAAICSPSRMGLLCGQYQQRYGFDFQPHQRYPRSWVGRLAATALMAKDGWVPAKQVKRAPSKRQAKASGIPAEAETIAERLQKTGYQTALFGKWHLGYAPEHHPLRHGFDHFYGFVEAYSLYASRKDPLVINAPVPLFADKVQWKKRKGPRAIERNGRILKEGRYLTDAITEEAIQYIGSHKSGKPFFALLSYNAPHAPWQAPRKIYEQLPHIQDHHQRVYCAMVIALDRAIGRLLNYLDDQGLTQNTMILLTSDNGVASYNGHVNSRPLKGGKFTLFEGGVNVPLLASWPVHIPAGAVMAEPVSLLDLSPTIAAAAGAGAGGFDGINLLPGLQGAKAFASDRSLFWRSGYNLGIIKSPWKLILNEKDQTCELFDLHADPFEQRDQALQRPQDMRILLGELNQWNNTMRPPAWPHVVDYETVINGKKYRFAI